MLIGIDGNEANVEKRVGISEYAFELLTQFYQILNPKSEILNKFKIQPFGFAQGENSKFKIYLKEKPRDDLPIETEWWRYRVIGPRKLWTQIGLPLDLHLHRPRPEVFFTPTHYAPRFSPIPTVISIMDLSYIHFPQLFKKSDLYQLRNWTAYSVKKASRVLTISTASKNDIIKVYKIPSERVVVTYPGIKRKSQSANRKMTSQNSKLLKNKYGIEGNYILFVGTLQPRKNIARLIEAFAKLARGPVAPQRRGTTPRSLSLVIVGKKGWLYEEILAAPKKFGVEDRVSFLDFVPDEDLAALYQNAQCFVLPSLYEGFGLPILEAMANGCPVIASNVSSLPEAGGDAALYVDPTNVDDIAEKMQTLLTNEKLRKELIEKGYRQVKKFSWEKTARETLQVLEEVARDRK